MLGLFKSNNEERILTKDVFPSSRMTEIPVLSVKTVSARRYELSSLTDVSRKEPSIGDLSKVRIDDNNIPVLTEVYKEAPQERKFASVTVKINGRDIKDIPHKAGFYCKHCEKILALPSLDEMVSAKDSDGNHYTKFEKCLCCNIPGEHHYFSFIKKKPKVRG